MKTYQKVMFSSNAGKTAGLVVPADRVQNASVSDLSRLFPYSESGKMARVHVSPEYPTFEAAFAHSFES